MMHANQEFDAALAKKMGELRSMLASMGSVLVAYSGGVDSTFLAVVASEVLGVNALAVTATSPTYAARELAASQRVVGELALRHLVVESNELEVPGFSSNPPERCYLCKSHLYGQLRELATRHGMTHVVDGTNRDDQADYRPGRKAAQEHGVKSPLLELGFTKADIRAASRDMGLPTADKPASACLASRFPYGTEITVEKLGQVEAVESFLAEQGFLQFRARHHGEVLRLELDGQGMERMLRSDMRQACVARIKELGFLYVALDLDGYRTGSANEALGEAARAVHAG